MELLEKYLGDIKWDDVVECTSEEKPNDSDPTFYRFLGSPRFRGGTSHLLSASLGSNDAERSFNYSGTKGIDDEPRSRGTLSRGLSSREKPVGARRKEPMRICASAQSTETKLDKKPALYSKIGEFLSDIYNTNVTVTDIKNLPQTRKDVREVWFRAGNSFRKIWMFQSDPEQTIRELNIYYIAHQHGIPTGNPIGYEPGKKSYPIETAVIGGIVEHAGGPYDDYIIHMAGDSDFIFETAENVAQLMAQYHFELTKAKDEFAKYGIELEKASPRKELNERFISALGIKEKDAEELIKACEQLYNKQKGPLVISHGDIHTGNIVTLAEMLTGERDPPISFDKFGVIDWGSVMLDTQCGDMLDFWLHHERLASGICNRYPYDSERFENSYLQAIKNLTEETQEEFPAQKQTVDRLVQSSLWNLYEMYDPTRLQTLQEKAKYHCEKLMTDLDELDNHGCRRQTAKIRKELKRLIGNKIYLSRFFQ